MTEYKLQSLWIYFVVVKVAKCPYCIHGQTPGDPIEDNMGTTEGDGFESLLAGLL